MDFVWKSLSLYWIFICLCFCALQVGATLNGRSVYLFKQSLSDTENILQDEKEPLYNPWRRKREAEVTETQSERDDGKCKDQLSYFNEKREQLKNGSRLEERHVFANETKYSLALAWAGQNDAGILLILTTDGLDFFFEPPVSTLWRSKDHGRTWTDITSKVDNEVFRKEDGLQRNPHNPSKVYLISYEHNLYLTEDGGETWKKSIISSDVSRTESIYEQLEFHPEPQFEDYVAIISDERQLFVTYDNFYNRAKPIKKGVHTVKWGTAESKTQKCLFVTTADFSNPFTMIGPEMMDLERYDSDSDTWKTILRRVVVFDVQEKFIYASIFKSEHPKTQDEERLMMISSDGGETWEEAKLPTLTEDRFFSVMDMSEDTIFMHVDNPGDTGHGILYTSSANGLVYAESLNYHLFPNYGAYHDFYKIESIRGVYITSQMSEDESIHTVITYNRGGEWKRVPQPVGTDCSSDGSKQCSLQIHNSYSIHRGVNAQMPHSQKEAYGLVLVHAHVAKSLLTAPPDVYLSTDGGYNFRRVLKGPHAYEIADSGGLLVAVPLDTDYPNIVKFSTDEGNCWHIYKFTNEEIKFTGLITEPGGKSMTIGLWGYSKYDRKWSVSVIDFSTIVTRQCKEEDYISWTPHTSLNTKPGYEGCLLGRKETFKRIKQDSWCRNGYYKNTHIVTEICKCTEEDYECDYGFYRPVDSMKCVKQPQAEPQCNGLESSDTPGYRLIPGNMCDKLNGFHPAFDTTLLDTGCNKTGDQIHGHPTPPVEPTGSITWVVAAIIIVVLVLVSVVGAFFTYRMVLLRRHKVVYRYSKLNQAEDKENELENALSANHHKIFSDSSDDEVEQENHSPKSNGTAVPAKDKSQVKSYHDDSDDDMLA